MALRKNPKYDIKLHYKRTLEISLIISLFVVIAAFKLVPNFGKVAQYIEPPQEVITTLDIPATAEQLPPPPPPKPQVVVEAPADEPIPDVEIGGTDIDPNANIAPPLPPVEPKEEEEHNIFVPVEEMPTPVGGLSGILSKLQYPEIAIKAGIQGKVIVRALISKTGDVESAEVLQGIGGGCDEEALRVVYETKFNPGKQRSKPVRVMVTVPIRFILQ